MYKYLYNTKRNLKNEINILDKLKFIESNMRIKTSIKV